MATNAETKATGGEHQEPAATRHQAVQYAAPSLAERLQSLGVNLEDLEEAAQARLARIRWGGGPRCPERGCGSLLVRSVANRKPMPYRCRRCRRHFSVTLGTLIESTKVGCLKLLVACYLLAAHHPDITCAQLAFHLGLTEKPARRLRELFLAVVDDAASAIQTATADRLDAGVDHEQHVGAAVKPCADDHVAAERVDPLDLTWAVLGILLQDKGQTGDLDSPGSPPEASNPGGSVGNDEPSAVEEPDWNVLLPRLDSFNLTQQEPAGDQTTALERGNVGGCAAEWNGAPTGGFCAPGGKSVDGSDESDAETPTAHVSEPEDGRKATAAPVSSQPALLPTAAFDDNLEQQTLPGLEVPKVQNARPKASKRAKPRQLGGLRRKASRESHGQIRLLWE